MMNSKKKHEAFAKSVFAKPFPRLPDGELEKQYGDLIGALGPRLAAAFARPCPVDLWVKAVVRAGRTVFEVVDRAADVVVDALTGSGGGLAPAFATRGMASGGGSTGAVCVGAAKGGRAAHLRVTLEGAGDRRDLRVGFEDGTGRRLAPMTLTVTDGENQERLLDGVRYGSGEAVLRGIEDGVYELCAEGGGETASFALKLGER